MKNQRQVYSLFFILSHKYLFFPLKIIYFPQFPNTANRSLRKIPTIWIENNEEE